eukprot:1214573-Ditylum_brightwellii.AAC.2
MYGMRKGRSVNGKGVRDVVKILGRMYEATVDILLQVQASVNCAGWHTVSHVTLPMGSFVA